MTRRTPEFKIHRDRIDVIFAKLSSLTDRIVRNNWDDRVLNRFSKTSKVDEDYEPLEEPKA